MLIKRYTRYVVVILIIITILILATVNFASEYRSEKIQEYCYDINYLIKDYDFSTAKINDSSICMYDEFGEKSETIQFPEYDENIKLLYIRKEEDLIYFVIEGVVDDEEGIVFINSEVNNFFAGITSFERIGGNSYKYSSRGRRN